MVKETIIGRGATLEDATQKLYAGVATFAKERGYIAPEDPAAFQSAQTAIGDLAVDPERVRLSAVYDLQPVKGKGTRAKPAPGTPSGAAPSDYHTRADVTDRIM